MAFDLNEFPVEFATGRINAINNLTLNDSAYQVCYSWVQPSNKTLHTIYLGGHNVTGTQTNIANVALYAATSSGTPTGSLLASGLGTPASYTGYAVVLSGFGLSLIAGNRYSVVQRNVAGTPASNHFRPLLEPIFLGRKEDGILCQSPNSGVTWIGSQYGVNALILKFTDGTRWGPPTLGRQGGSTYNSSVPLYNASSTRAAYQGVRFEPDNSYAITGVCGSLYRSTAGSCGDVVCKVFKGTTFLAASVETYTHPLSGNNAAYAANWGCFDWTFNPPVIIQPGEDIIVAFGQSAATAGDSTNYYGMRAMDGNVTGLPVPSSDGSDTIPWKVRGVESTAYGTPSWSVTPNANRMPSIQIRMVPISNKGSY